MSAQNVVHTISPGAAIPIGYFDDDNITFIQSKVSEILLREYVQHIIMSKADIVRVMMGVLAERRENVPKMNQRVLMILTNDFRNHQDNVNKHLKWEDGYFSSQMLVDPVGGISRFDERSIKTNDKRKYDNKTRVGGTMRFYFT